MPDAGSILMTLINIASDLRREFALAPIEVEADTPISELGFESLHMVEFMLSISEASGEEIIEQIELSPEQSLRKLAKQIEQIRVGQKIGIEP